MSRKSLAQLLSTLDPTRWRRSRYLGDAASEDRWLPVLDLYGHGFPIGITKDGTWVVESVGGLEPLASEPALDSLLGCLYHPRPEVVRRLRSGVEALGLPVTASESFPFVELVAHALDFSPFYADLALEWIEEGSGGEEFVPLLEGVMDADETRFPQRIRQRATELRHQIRAGSTKQ